MLSNLGSGDLGHFYLFRVRIKEAVDDSLVVCQDRKDYVTGAKKCYISMLKPVIGADGCIYPCCGVQYAKDPMPLDYDESMKMGSVDDIQEVFMRQKVYDGSECTRCYYSGYNVLLSTLIAVVDHEVFV